MAMTIGMADQSSFEKAPHLDLANAKVGVTAAVPARRQQPLRPSFMRASSFSLCSSSPCFAALLLSALLLLLQAPATDANKLPDLSLKTLLQKDLVCSSCRYIFGPLDDWAKEELEGVPMSKKKARRWLREKLAKETVCKETRFSRGMGVETQGDGQPPRLLERAALHAKRSGFSERGGGHMARVFDGTHEEIRQDPTIGPHVLAACKYWSVGILQPLAGALEGLLKERRAVVDFVCNERLTVCKTHDEL